MRIGIDVSALVKEATGIGQWIIQVTNRLLSIDQKNDYFLFTYDHLRVDLKLNSRTQIVSLWRTEKPAAEFPAYTPRTAAQIQH